MEKRRAYTFWPLIILLIVFGPIYLIEIFNIRYFATAKMFDIPSGGFLIWIYYLVVAAVALIIAAVINRAEKSD